MIIDAHLHLGTDDIWDATNTEEGILAELDRAGVEVGCVLPQTGEPTIEWAQAAHDRIAAFAEANPGRIFGLANAHPYLPFEDYEAEITRCVKELGFRLIKIHSWASGVNPLGEQMRMVWDLARRLDVPVMVHTGAGMPASNPAMFIPLAQQFPEVPLILAHAGQGFLFGQVVTAASLCPNIYIDSSMISAGAITGFVRRFGADRVMFASDNEKILTQEVGKWRSLPISEEEFEQCAWRTATQLYKLPFEL
jgi:predicted TIM-barrel fold metal-dependent hydrolase